MHMSKFTLSAGLLCLVLVLAAATEEAQPKEDAGADNSQRNVGISLGSWNLGNLGGFGKFLGLGAPSSSSLPSGISVGTGISTDNAASASGTSIAIGIPTGTDALAGGLAAGGLTAGALGAGALGAGALGAGALSTGALGFGAGALAVLKAYFKAFTFGRLVTMGMGAALLATGVGLIIAFGVLASELRRRSGYDSDPVDEDNYAQFR